jgi:hypothetical protein
METAQERAKQRETEPQKIKISPEIKLPKKFGEPELADMNPRFQKYVSISDDYSMIEQFTCPVEGCSFQTDQGPGALRMHMLIAADPNLKGRYNPQHEAFIKANPNEMTIEGVRYLAQFKSSFHLDASIKNIKE